MGYIIEITEDKVESLAENAEKMLRYGGKLMQCIEEMRNDDGQRMGERHGRGDYRNGYGRDDDNEYFERRRRY